MESLEILGEEGMELEGSVTTAVYENSTLVGVTNVTDVTNTTYSPFYQHSLFVAATYIVVYCFIFLLCMAGNILVCLIVLENHRMRSVTNLFILNLAISDLLVGIFCIPTTLVDNLITGWPFSNTMCKMSGFVQGVSVSASVFTLVAIAVERFRCIVFPLQPRPTVLFAMATITLIWALAMVIMSPAAMALTVEKVPNHYMVHNDDFNNTLPLYTCFEDFSKPQMRKAYTACLFAVIYMMPLAAITLMYGSIGVKLCTSVVPNREPQLANADDQVGGRRGGQQLISKKKIRVIKMLIVVALLFMISWLPLWTLMMMADYSRLTRNQLDLLTSYIFPFAHWLAFANSSINPIIYGYYNENFKRGFQAVCKSRPCCTFLLSRLWRRMAQGGKSTQSGRTPNRATDFRDGGVNHNHQALGGRNRVHNDHKLSDSEGGNKSGRVGCVVVHSQRSITDQGLEIIEIHKRISSGEESDRVASRGVYQAWEN